MTVPRKEDAGAQAGPDSAAGSAAEPRSDSAYFQLLASIYGPYMDLSTEAARSFLSNALSFRKAAAGQYLRRPGEACARIPLVLKGALRVFKISETGREIELYRIGTGGICLLSCGSAGKAPFPAYISAAEDSLIAGLDTAAFHKMLAECAQFRDFVLDQYASRFSELIDVVDEVAFRHLDARLKAALIAAARPAGPVQGPLEPRPSQPPAVAATHQELADRLGTSREVVSRILKDWESRGAIRLGRGRIELLPAFYSLTV